MSDLSLPKTADTEKYSHENHDKDKIAVYALVQIQGGFTKLQQALLKVNPTVTNSYQFSETTFIGKPLRDVLEYHLSVAEQYQVDPSIFIAVHTENFIEDGVLLINANFDLKGGVDKCRVKASIALLEAVNLQIGNVDWWDIEREDADKPAPLAPSAGEDGSIQAPVIFGAYGIRRGADMTQIRGLLEPGWQEKKPSAWLCESVGSYTSGDNTLEQVIKHHPWHCKQKPRMSKQWCICVDNLNPSKEGVLILHIDWDGDMTRPKLLEIGTQSPTRVERVDAKNALRILATKDS